MKRIRGFTLIELILTIVVVGIIAIAASNTLVLGFQSYNDSIDRQDNQMQAKFVIEKLSRELRHAVPNSAEVISRQCVSFIPLKVSAFYFQLPQFNQKQIDVVLLSNNTVTLDNFRLVINPSSQSDLLDDAHHRFITIESMTQSGGISTIHFPNTTNNPAFISSSVSERAFIYRPSVVEYCIQAGGVFRDGVQIANHVTSGGFSIDNASLNRNSMIKMVLTFENDLGEATQYQHDVQVINVP
ncbi:type II secretion system protein [Aliivibrio sp. S2TY2]|uniref:PilW family protein n=1 Tax=unclassified Aliivibrio TaxID=2645654 RepID=UPI002379F2EE|nr:MULTISPECIES: type II secretion system protein [unclassified Aliivibrio]MDD9175567.1 type II secretion system protein [Aliivibrio sp. S3TY1]MDD9192646.1 type II secretion system protein [Aliivibrio sp. S2TY2]